MATQSASRPQNKQFEYKYIKLSTPNADAEIDLAPSWVQIEFTESIFSPFIAGNITILDAGGFMELIPIIGEETLFVTLGTGEFRGTRSTEVVPELDFEIKGKFKIYKVSQPAKTNTDKGKLYTLYFVSDTYFRNRKARVQKGYQNLKISEITKQIYEEFIQNRSVIPTPADDFEKDINIEHTRFKHSFCIPAMSPYQAINMIGKKAISMPPEPTARNQNPVDRQGATFLFYETMDSFEFASLEKLLTSDVQQTLVYAPKATAKDHQETLEASMNAVEMFEIVKTFDVLENLDEGMYSSKLVTYDMIKQSFKEIEYNYIPKTPESISKPQTAMDRTTGRTDVVPAGAENKQEKLDAELEDLSTHLAPGKLCSEQNDLLYNPRQKLYLKPTRFNHNSDYTTNDKIAGGPTERGILPDNLEISFLQRKSQLQQMQNIKLGIRIKGNSERHVGQMVEFKLPSEAAENFQGAQRVDQHLFYSGKFIITQARHVFVNVSGEGGTYSTHLELSKDSLNVSVPGAQLEELTEMSASSLEEERAVAQAKALTGLTRAGKVTRNRSIS